MVETVNEIVEDHIKPFFHDNYGKKDLKYCASIATLCKDIFGVEGLSHKEVIFIFLHFLHGVKTTKIPNGDLKDQMIKKLDIESREDFLQRILFYKLKHNQMVIIPSEEEVARSMTLDQAIDESL